MNIDFEHRPLLRAVRACVDGPTCRVHSSGIELNHSLLKTSSFRRAPCVHQLLAGVVSQLLLAGGKHVAEVKEVESDPYL